MCQELHNKHDKLNIHEYVCRQGENLPSIMICLQVTMTMMIIITMKL